MKEIMGMDTSYKSSFVQDGLDSEPEIIQKYSKLTGQSVSKCGFFICEKYPFLGASPDSLIGSEGLVEAKKIHLREKETLNKALLRQRICKESSYNPDELDINKNHKYYFQVQQQLLCTQRSWCDFVASDGHSLYIKRIEFYKEF